MDETNKIIYDWVTFTSKIHSVGDIIELLGLDDVDFIALEHGMNGYPCCIHFEGISICYGGREDMGVCCCMSGQGCRSFETYGNGDYRAIFDCVLDNWNEDGDKRQMNLTRLDVAYDDFEGLLDIDVIRDETTAQNYVSRFNKWCVTYGSEGCSVCFGSVKSDTYFRIYDKKAERKRDDLEHWVRCEIQLRNTSALGFAALDDGDICENYFGVLNNYLRFVTPNPTDSNKRRWSTAPWWDKFLESYDRVSIFRKPGTEYNILRLDSYINNQLSGALMTYIDVVGVDKFVSNIVEARKGKKLNPKYVAIKSMLPESDKSTLNFLKERGLLETKRDIHAVHNEQSRPAAGRCSAASATSTVPEDRPDRLLRAILSN